MGSTNRPLSFAARPESEGGHSAPSEGLAPHDRGLDDHGRDAALKVNTSLPSGASATSSTPLRPNRLGPVGDVELGGGQDLQGNGAWVNDWTSRYRSPLGKSLIIPYLPASRADDPQTSWTDELTDSWIIMSFFLVFG